jgi:5'(3')-deoxyribonucleotidase
MKKDKIILTDCDGVLLSWLSAFNRFMVHQGFNPIELSQFTTPSHYGISEEQINDYVTTFNSGHWEFGTLPPYRDAQNGVKQLFEMGYRFVVITSCSSHPQTIALRRANLFNHFGDVFEHVHCIDVGESKRSHLADYEPSIWIEDTPRHAEDGLIYGHNCILMTEQWNKNYNNDRIKRVHNWDEIVNHIVEKSGC